MRTKAEVGQFLESRVGTVPIDASNAKLNGQCVALIKDLMNFLGVPGAYNARGNAKDVGDAYIRQNIGTSGRGWLTVCVNRNMGGQYGHVWVDLLNEGNYESNGAIALRVTKNTRPISQAQQFINFDQWIKGEDMQSEVDKLWKAIDSFNKREDKRIKDINDDKFKLWKALDRTNKNADVLRKAVQDLEKQTDSKIDLNDYEIQLVKKEK